MRIALRLEDAATTVQPIARRGLGTLRESLPALPNGASATTGESKTATAHTWYLSALRSIDSDEVSVSVTIRSNEPGSVDLTADVCFGARILIDDEAITTRASPEAMLGEFFDRAVPVLRDAIDALMKETNPTTGHDA